MTGVKKGTNPLPFRVSFGGVMDTESSAVLQTETRTTAQSYQNGSVHLFPEKKSTPPGRWRSSSRTEHPRLCLSVGSRRVVVGYTELTPFQGTSWALPPVACPRVPGHPGLPTPRSPFPSSLSTKVTTPGIAERGARQPGQNPESWNPAPERPGGHWACSVVRQVRGREPLLRLADSSGGRASSSSSSRAGSGRMMAAAAAAGSTSGGGSSGGGGGGSSSSDTSSTGEEERMRRLFQTCDGDGDGYISRYWGGTRNRLGRSQPLSALPLTPSSAHSPQLPASCSEAHGKSWLRLRERVAGSAPQGGGG